MHIVRSPFASPFGNSRLASKLTPKPGPKSSPRRRLLRKLRRHLKSAVSISVMLAVLCPSMVAAPQVIAGAASEWKTSLLFWLDSSGLSAKVIEWVTGDYRPTPQAQEGQ
ncbi:MAG TPA: hypothetical protein VD861_13215, partial [Pyrinomonadaceae bacterium]|nr:hypothetical protein [Pyrinomonadaceae bacterium]